MATTHSSIEENNNARTIVVVEDDDGIGDFIVQAIQQETSHRVVRFAEGYEAWNLMQYRRLLPDLLILDYNLPLMTGIELYDRIHVIKEFAHIPVLIVSAYHRLCKEVAKTRNLPCLEKPFALDDLLDMVEKLIV